METVESKDSYDEIDLMQAISSLLSKWKTVLIITIVGTLVTIGGASLIPNQYRSIVHVGLPSDADVVVYGQNSLVQLNKNSIFLRFMDLLKSDDNFVNFLQESQNDKLSLLMSQTNEGRLMIALLNSISVDIMESTIAPPDAPQYPSKIQFSMVMNDEKLITELANEYVNFTMAVFNQSLLSQSKDIKEYRLTDLQVQISELRENAKQLRLNEIQRRKEKNAKEIAKLEQQMSLLVQKVKNKRFIEIATIKENNSVTIETLKQQYDLTIEKAKADRATQIANARVALELANELGIELPTPVYNFSSRQGNTQETNIHVAGNASLPLYLMGKKYLKALISSLENRQDDSIFLSEVNEIKKQLAEVENDKKLEHLENRENDESIIEELAELTESIAAIKDDKELQLLEKRTNDDVYIESLPKLQSEMRLLQNIKLDLSSVKPAQILKSAFPTGKAYNSKVKKFIVIIGALLSALFSVVFVLISSQLTKR